MIDIFVGYHLLLKTNQGFLHIILRPPGIENVELIGLNSAIALVHAGQVDLRLKVNLWGLLRIVGSTFDCQEEDTVVKFGVRRSNNGAIPFCESSVIT